MELKIQVAERLAESNTIVRERVIEHLKNQEVERRTDATLKVVAKIDDVTKELKKLTKPDIENFDEDGKSVYTAFSKERAKQIKDAKELKEKLEKALEKALTSNEFDKVFELSK